MPLAGSSATFTPMLMMAWKPKIERQAAEGQRREGIGLRLGPRQDAQHDEGEERHEHAGRR